MVLGASSEARSSSQQRFLRSLRRRRTCLLSTRRRARCTILSPPSLMLLRIKRRDSRGSPLQDDQARWSGPLDSAAERADRWICGVRHCGGYARI